jgi:hypothetical protein
VAVVVDRKIRHQTGRRFLHWQQQRQIEQQHQLPSDSLGMYVGGGVVDELEACIAKAGRPARVGLLACWPEADVAMQRLTEDDAAVVVIGRDVDFAALGAAAIVGPATIDGIAGYHFVCCTRLMHYATTVLLPGATRAHVIAAYALIANDQHRLLSGVNYGTIKHLVEFLPDADSDQPLQDLHDKLQQVVAVGARVHGAETVRAARRVLAIVEPLSEEEHVEFCTVFKHFQRQGNVGDVAVVKFHGRQARAGWFDRSFPPRGSEQACLNDNDNGVRVFFNQSMASAVKRHQEQKARRAAGQGYARAAAFPCCRPASSPVPVFVCVSAPSPFPRHSARKTWCVCVALCTCRVSACV